MHLIYPSTSPTIFEQHETKIFFFLCQDCQNVSGSYPHFWDLLATLPCLLSVLFPLSWGWTNSIHPAYIFGFLLVCHVSLNGQSTGLLLYESQVSWYLAFTFFTFSDEKGYPKSDCDISNFFLECGMNEGSISILEIFVDKTMMFRT